MTGEIFHCAMLLTSSNYTKKYSCRSLIMNQILSFVEILISLRFYFFFKMCLEYVISCVFHRYVFCVRYFIHTYDCQWQLHILKFKETIGRHQDSIKRSYLCLEGFNARKIPEFKKNEFFFIDDYPLITFLKASTQKGKKTSIGTISCKVQ